LLRQGPILAILAFLASPETWTFEKDDLDRPPAAFAFTTTREGPGGRWLVKRVGEKNVLAQVDTSRVKDRFAMAIVKGSSYRDVSLSVRAFPVGGEMDQAAGLVWRYQDADNYYLARSNVLEKNVRLYRVVNGNRIKFAGREEIRLQTNEWHALGIEHRGSRIAVYLRGEKIFEATDKTFPDSGRIGVWIKSDSVTYFADLAARELSP
jgi:hypothetical protein